MAVDSNTFMKNRRFRVLNNLAFVVLLTISLVACRPTEQPVFYGKLRDQTSEGVADAEVTVTFTSKGSGNAPSPAQVRTDSNGVFTLNPIPGATVELNVRKTGYALAATNTTFHFDPTTASPSNSAEPVVIKMWKLQGREPLHTFSDTAQFQNSGVPVYFDVIAKKFVPDYGDIKITINRPDGTMSASNHPDWSVHVETTHEGGSIEVTPEIWRTSPWAPPDGWEPHRMFLVSGNGPHPWSTNAQAYYFIQSREGSVYSKMALKISINPDAKAPYEISVAGVANTNGACNWEADIGSPIPQ